MEEEFGPVPFSPDGRTVLSEREDDVVMVAEVASGKEQMTLNHDTRDSGTKEVLKSMFWQARDTSSHCKPDTVPTALDLHHQRRQVSKDLGREHWPTDEQHHQQRTDLSSEFHSRWARTADGRTGRRNETVGR